MLLTKKYKHCIWDWNGTLFDDVNLCLDLINELLKEYQLGSITLEHYREVFGFPVKEYYRRVGFDFSRVPFETVAIQFIDAYNSRRYEAGLFTGTHSILSQLMTHNLSHSVLSAYRHAELEATIQRLGIADCFGYISGISDQFAAGKVDNGKALIEKIPYTREEVVLIGDTDHDFEVAQAIGIDCILVAHGHHSRGRLALCRVPVVENLHDLV